MAGLGRISVFVSRELQVLLSVTRTLDREVAARLRRHTRSEAEPIFREEVRGRVTTRLQTRVLSDTTRVAVSDTNVNLKTAMVGKLSSGVSAGVLAPMVEFGADPDKAVTQRSRKGKNYTRKLGRVTGLPRRNGYVFHPAVRDSIPRIASLWIQTAYRTVAETFEKGER